MLTERQFMWPGHHGVTGKKGQFGGGWRAVREGTWI